MALQMTDTTLLKNVDLFRAVDDAKLDRLGDACLQRTLSRGDELFVEGDHSNELFVVESGLIAIANQSFDGRESVVALMEPGDIFGEMPLFDGKGRSAAARALEPSVVLLVPYQPVRDLYDEDPTQLWSAVDMLTRRLRSMDGALADSVFLDVTGRTAKRLLEMAGDEDEFALPVTQEELAGMVGASRERVNKAIASFVKLGWLQQNERRYNILDRNQMQIRSR
jgi:CRP/FNR family cyclic AMP-dependent transcriptional regulator